MKFGVYCYQSHGMYVFSYKNQRQRHCKFCNLSRSWASEKNYENWFHEELLICVTLKTILNAIKKKGGQL